MRATEFLTELFQPGKDWKWSFTGSEEAVAVFHVGKVPYMFHAYGPDPIWEVEFKQYGNKLNRSQKFGLTGTGNSAEVMSTIVDIMRAFLEKYKDKIEVLIFSAKEDSRQGLYARMVKRLLPDWTMKQEGESFVLTAPKQVDEEITDEMALKQFTPMGDFEKPGPFKAVDKRLVQHQTNQLKAEKFFEQTPYDFRLFFSNIPGTGKYAETGPVNAQQLQQMFGPEYANQILADSEDAITVVFVGNSGADKVMITPWIMAHRFGHAIQAGARRNQGWNTWKEAEKHFFTTVNTLLADYYRKQSRSSGRQHDMQGDLTQEYNALFNALGTQRSSRTGQIKRPYEFLYEIFAQYLKTGEVTFNPLPQRIDYGRKAWGTSTKGMSAQPGAEDLQDMAEILARDMHYMFDDVLSSSVGNIYVM